MSSVNIAMGVDIGGTHITAALIDLQNKKVIPASVKRSTVNAAGTPDEIINTWSRCMTSAMEHADVNNICVAIPGPFEYETGISLMRGQDKYENLYGLNIKERLALSLNLPKQAVFMDNDAACFLQGEVFNGVASAYDNGTVMGITLGTGLGSAFFKEGKSRNADMWCWPFKESIAEDYLSTRWFVQRWDQLTNETISGVRELTERHATNENTAILFAEFAEHLSSFLLDFIAKESPDAIVIGGNIAKAFDWFGPALIASIGGKQRGIKIVPAKLGEEAQLLGAVSSWLQRQKTMAGFS
jgi:glucokinase